MRDRTERFFDEQAARYRTLQIGNEPANEEAARKIESAIQGSVLSLGGLWDQARPMTGAQVIAADRSREMLRAFAQPKVTLVQCDARQLPFASSCLDHAVLPLVLHHVTGGSGFAARRHARQILRQVRSLVRPGGRIWINETYVSSVLYALQLFFAPLTARILRLAGQSLVVMHSRSFYANALRETDWEDILIEPISPEDARPFDLVIPILGMPWLRVPRFIYPIHPVLISARRPRC